MICWDRVKQLRDDIGAECFAEIVEAFLAEMDEATAALAATTEASEQQKLFHFLKGGAVNLGFCDFADQCAHYENVSQSAAVSPAELAQLVASYQAAKSSFESGLLQLSD